MSNDVNCLWTVRVHEMCLVIRLIVIDVCA